MTDRINEIRARLEGVTEGPWNNQHSPKDADGCLSTNDIMSPKGQVVSNDGFRGVNIKRRQHDANAEFIARARQDIPYLLVEIDRLMAEADETRKFFHLGCDSNNGGAHEIITHGTYKFCGKCGYSIKAPTMTQRCKRAEDKLDVLQNTLAAKDAEIERLRKSLENAW